jgi:dipeptidyl aminopeptidase/acylaminoacyl peptidase
LERPSKSSAKRAAGVAAIVLCHAITCVGAADAAAPPPVADFFKAAPFADLKMSPSGKLISATIPAPNGRRQLAVLDLQNLAASKVVVGFTGVDVSGVSWISDDRLAFRVYDQQGTVPDQRVRWMSVESKGNSAPVPLGGRLFSLLRDGSNDAITAEFRQTRSGDGYINLHRLNTANGGSRSLSIGMPDGVVDAALDPEGNPRVVITRIGLKLALHWKVTPGAEWVKAAEAELPANKGMIDPIFVDASNRLFASARVEPNGDTRSLVVIDMAKGVASAQPILSAPGYDIYGGLVRGRGGVVLGVRYLTDAQATHWFDAGLKTIQDEVDKLLPSTINHLDCGECGSRDKVLVSSRSDRQPAIYTLYDSKARTLSPVAASRPWIEPKAMAMRSLARFQARDGLSIPVHVTRPVGQKGPAPAVVLVHGGPYLRGGEWDWDPDSQFLASRGYVVIEPEFRGSTGFGDKHFRAGWKQWGLAMQDDIADAAQWAVQQGYADGRRICIAGASYGGYATLMGLIRNPEIFRCGVEWAGITDIDLMYSIHWSDVGEKWKEYDMPMLIGDRVKDADQLAATSPVRLAHKVTQPLLMAYGGLDRRVPIDHGTKFRDAVEKNNKQLEWIVYATEGHGWSLPANAIDFWTRVERFLDKNLKNAL